MEKIGLSLSTLTTHRVIINVNVFFWEAEVPGVVEVEPDNLAHVPPADQRHPSSSETSAEIAYFLLRNKILQTQKQSRTIKEL